MASVASTHTRPDVAEILDDPEAETAASRVDVTPSSRASSRSTRCMRMGSPIRSGAPSPSTRSPGPVTPPSRCPRNPPPVRSTPVTRRTSTSAASRCRPARTSASYQLAELSSSTGDVGDAELELTDAQSALANRERRILVGTLPLAGDAIRVRVGSCLQWHGYTSDTLYLTQRDVYDPVDKIVLSGVTRPYQE